ncbi:MAG: hypothetical protein OXH00_21465 [Candidatus Poribacteria bacterium]|nr:hypothetical protein [Candidatus Poribacteria bacterium]
MWYYHVTDLPIPHHSESWGPLFETYAAFAEHDPLLVGLLDEWFHRVSFRGLY